MKTKIINYLFEDDEKELIDHYVKLLRIVAVCLILGIIAIIL